MSGAGAAGASPSITVANNTIAGNATQGIYVDNFFGGPSQNVLFTGDTIAGNGGAGLRVDLSSNIAIGKAGAAIDDIEHNGANGIALFSDANVTLTNNKDSYNSATGVYMYSYSSTSILTNVVLTNNTISNNASDGVYISTYCTLVTMPSGDTVQNNGVYGVEIQSTPIPLPSVATNTITGNIKGNITRL